MRYFILALSLLGLVLHVTAQEKVVFHDRDAEIRSVGDFHSIDVSSAIDLQISQSDEIAVAVSAPGEENRAGIKTEVKNGVLRIWYEQKKWFRGSKNGVRVYVAVKKLNKLTASGACDIKVNGVLKSDELMLKLSGASDFNGQVNAASVKMEQSGASDVVIRGTVGDLVINASGASHFRGYDLVADNCRVNASGASDIKITVNKILNAHASGATNIDYKGSGTIGDLRASGASNIRKRS